MEPTNDKEINARVEVKENGPLKITGNIVFTDLKRGITLTESEVYICRCTKSNNQPFCDGSHGCVR
jgi:CDGSH-type Zn-finger protein